MKRFVMLAALSGALVFANTAFADAAQSADGAEAHDHDNHKHDDHKHGDHKHDDHKHDASPEAEGDAGSKTSSMEAAKGEVVTANVNGLVCDFCAQAVKKVFGKQAAVDAVDVDLSVGVIRVAMKPGQTLDDEVIGKLIRDSGYSLVSIERTPAT
ncbi:MAG: heavy-metal-associated domain-containing protein [Pseudomonadota bacterium]